jgi:hypothetical protein
MSSRNNRLNNHRKGTNLFGPYALEEWVWRFRAAFRSAYRHHPGKVIWAMPRTESLKDPPLGFDIVTREEAHQRLKSLRAFRDGTGLEGPPRGGMFYVVASRAEGRFRGTFIGMLPVPGPDESLPPTGSLNEDLFVPPLPPTDPKNN